MEKIKKLWAVDCMNPNTGEWNFYRWASTKESAVIRVGECRNDFPDYRFRWAQYQIVKYGGSR